MTHNGSNKNDNHEQELSQKEKDLAHLRKLLLEGMASPLSKEPMDAEYFKKMRKRVRAKAKR